MQTSKVAKPSRRAEARAFLNKNKDFVSPVTRASALSGSHVRGLYLPLAGSLPGVAQSVHDDRDFRLERRCMAGMWPIRNTVPRRSIAFLGKTGGADRR